MQREKYSEIIKKRIANATCGSVFILSDFFDIADTDVVRKAIDRMENDGTLLRIIRGVYYKPEFNKFLNEPVAPSPNEVAHAIARNFGWTIVPCGDTALNLLEISTQVPAQWVYVSDGAYREYTFDHTTIKFKRTTNKEISKISYKTALIIQALKAIGKENITEQIIIRLSKKLTPKEKSKTLAEAQFATNWIYEILKTICKDE